MSKISLLLAIIISLISSIHSEKSVIIIDETDFDLALADPIVTTMDLSNDLKLSSDKIIERNLTINLNSYSIMFSKDSVVGFTVKKILVITNEVLTKSNSKIYGSSESIFKITGTDGFLEIANSNGNGKIIIGDEVSHFNTFGIHLTKKGQLMTLGRNIEIYGGDSIYLADKGTNVYVKGDGVISGTTGINANSAGEVYIQANVRILGSESAMDLTNAKCTIDSEGDKIIEIGDNATLVAIESDGSEVEIMGNTAIFGKNVALRLFNNNKFYILSEDLTEKYVNVFSQNTAIHFRGKSNIIEINGKVEIYGSTLGLEFAYNEGNMIAFTKREIIRLSTSILTGDDSIYQFNKINDKKMIIYGDVPSNKTCQGPSRFTEHYYIQLDNDEYCGNHTHLETVEGEDLAEIHVYKSTIANEEELILTVLNQGQLDKPEINYICTECNFNSRFHKFYNESAVTPDSIILYQNQNKEISFNFYSELKSLEKIELINSETFEVEKTIDSEDLAHVIEEDKHKYVYKFKYDDETFGNFIPKVIFTTPIINMYDIEVSFTVEKFNIQTYTIIDSKEDKFEYPKNEFGENVIYIAKSIVQILLKFNDDKLSYGGLTLTDTKKYNFNYNISDEENDTLIINITATHPSFTLTDTLTFNLKYESVEYGNEDYEFSIIPLAIESVSPYNLVLDEEEGTEIKIHFNAEISNHISVIQIISKNDEEEVVIEEIEPSYTKENDAFFNLVKNDSLLYGVYSLKVFVGDPEIGISGGTNINLTINEPLSLDLIYIDNMKIEYDDTTNEIGIAANKTFSQIKIAHLNKAINEERISIKNSLDLEFNITYNDSEIIFEDVDTLIPKFTYDEVEFTITDRLKKAGKNTYSFSLKKLIFESVYPSEIKKTYLNDKLPRIAFKFSTLVPYLSNIYPINKDKRLSAISKDIINCEGYYCYFKYDKSRNWGGDITLNFEIESTQDLQSYKDLNITLKIIKDNKKKSAGAVIGILVGALVLVGVLIGLLMYLLKNKNTNNVLEPGLNGPLTA